MTSNTRLLIRAPQPVASGWLNSFVQRVTSASLVICVIGLLSCQPSASPAAAGQTLAPTSREAEHFKTFDAAIAGVRGYDLSVEDAARIRDCLKAISAQDNAKSLEIRNTIRDPIGLKLISWYRLRAGYGQINEYRAFLADNPSWPDRNILNQRFEELMFTEGGQAATIKAAFKDQAPKNGIGYAALASAELALGETEAAKDIAVHVWRYLSVPPKLETGFMERFGKFLSTSDHKWRLDRLLIEDIRWAADRNDRATAIRRQINRLPTDEQKIAEARLSVFLHDADAKARITAVQYDAKGDFGLLYHRIQVLRRANKIDDATRLMMTAPIDPKLTPNLDEWWVERRMLAYSVLNAGNAELAYELVKNVGPLGINPLKEQSFMAGWLAWRFLKNKPAAIEHFNAAAKAADGPLSRARAGYWLGRIAEAGSEKDKANEHYKQAAHETDTFYGQLSQLKLDPNNRRITITMPKVPSAEQIKRFNAMDVVKAIVVARKSGVDPSVPRILVANLKTYFDNETDAAMTAHLADAIGDTQLALRNAKTGIARKQNLLVYAYPLHTFPAFTPLSTPPETAFLLGVARQETEFNKDTVSGAGAKGLLQVMTVTAQHVCSDYKIKCELDRLLPDTAYNATIAAAYIGDRMKEFGGSYVLGLSGYNAGPGRSREWIRAFGDPRSPTMDPIDWIERIPFQETREYVAKVLSNIQIYRARLGNEDTALQLDLDLRRGREKTTVPAQAAGVGGAG